MLVAFDVFARVRALVKTARTFNDISRFDLCLTARQVREENLFRVAVLARETKIPLSGGKGTHAQLPRFRSGERNGALKCLFL